MELSVISIGIADDEALFRKGLRLLLEDFNDIKVIMEAEDGQDLLDRLAERDQHPEILLLDLKMPRLNGIEAAKILREDYPEMKIIILSTHYSKAFIINMIEIGAASYLPKNTIPEEVASTIRAVSHKGFYYNNEILEIMRENMMNKNIPKLKTPFEIEITQREKEVLQLICEQLTTTEIADKLFISPRTVDGHRNNLLSKLDCRNTAGLVVYALQNGLVEIKDLSL
ncbi:MAG: DNA-binding response regulator [Saprospiraceae bacterium]|nr:MAG: DNA-binding response regulator [Saprospiraceae bacterium]